MIVRLLKAFGVGLFVFVLSIVGASSIQIFGGPEVFKNYPWLQAVGPNSIMLIASLGIMMLSSQRWGDWGLQLPRSFSWPTLVATSLGVATACAAIMNIVIKDECMEFIKQLSFVQVVLVVFIYAPLCEELFCRGLLFKLVSSGYERVKLMSAPVLFPAIFFAATHLIVKSQGISWLYVGLIVGYAFVCGLVTGYYRALTASVVPSIVAHSLFNITGYIFYRILGC